VQTAIILAAGFGSRLGGLTNEMPKGFLEVGNKSLISRSVECLLRNSVNKIYIGTGHLSEYYDELAARYNNLISCVKNDRYAISSSMDKLFNLRSVVNEDFFLLESDLLYEDRALTTLRESDQKNMVLASGKTYGGDEVYIDVDDRGSLVSMTKDLAAADGAFGEFVGISKVSIEAYQKMCDIFSREGPLTIDYEYVMPNVAHPDNFIVQRVDDLVWCEIDDSKQLMRASSEVIFALDAANVLHSRH